MFLIFLVTSAFCNRLSRFASLKEYGFNLEAPVGNLGTASALMHQSSLSFILKYKPILNPLFEFGISKTGNVALI